MIKNISLCLIGFGNAAQAFCQLLLEKSPQLASDDQVQIRVVAITTRSKGSLYDLNGIDLFRSLHDIRSEGCFSDNHPQRATVSSIESIQRSGADVLVELSTLSITDGQPAIHHIETALTCGMHVITANKGPIAWDYRRLKKLSAERGKSLFHETVVMDGAPVFNLVLETLPGCKVSSFKGILNSTTNFILEAMESGSTREESIREAQLQGFAEADPSLDVDGWDAAAKTSALLNVLMDASITPVDIQRTGISDITLEDIRNARDQDSKIKLICEGWRDQDRVYGKVAPVLVSSRDLFSTVDATTSILCLTTDLMGEICIVERNPHIEQTAYGIYSDLLRIMKLHF